MSLLYVKLDANYSDDEKIILAGEKAELLYIRGLCLVKRILSDGFIADVHLPRFGLSGYQARARRLVEVGLWERDDAAGGYWIVSWLKHNHSADQVDEIRAKRRAAGSKGGRQRANQLAKQTGSDDLSKEPSNPSTQSRDRVETEIPSGANGSPRFVDRLRQELEEDHGWQLVVQDNTAKTYRALLSTALEKLPANRHQAVSMGVLADFYSRITGETITREARSHLARHVSSRDPLAVFDAVAEAFDWGAGVPEQYRDDPLAVSKYATKVLAAMQ